MKYLLHYLETKNIILIFSLITIQQTLNAFCTYAIAKAGLTFESRDQFIFWTLTSLLLFIFSPVINISVRRLESKLSFTAYKIFLKETLFSKSGNPAIWQNKNFKDRFLASTGSDALDYLGLVLFISTDIYSFCLSVVLGVFALSFTIDISLLPAFICSGLLSFAVYRRFSKKVEGFYSADQEARTTVGSHLLKSWDNVLLKNTEVIKNYLNAFNNKITTAQSFSMKSATSSEILVFSLGIATGLPVLISICWIIWNPNTNSQVLIALLATLPRQLNILSVFRNIFQSLTSLLGVEAKFSSLCEGTDIPERIFTSSIRAELITINKKTFTDLNAMTAEFEQRPNGRFEVRGPNGAGKSTFLLYLNHKLQSSIYLPTHPDLMINSELSSTRSSGENLLAHIEMLAGSLADIILLDEWDANLDQKNLELVNTRIDHLARTKTIIEVRHR